MAIVLDGNGRWAERRGKSRPAGHKAGVETVRRTIELCMERGIGVLTLFAFSSENWKRPRGEVSLLLDLFLNSLRREVGRLNENNVRLRIIGDTTAFSGKLQQSIRDAEALTVENHALELNIAANYGGRWDIAQAARRVAERVARGELDATTVDAEIIAAEMSLADLPEPDLFIRTGGESRISNFMLWQLAYSELYFTDLLWPDFDAAQLDKALAWYAGRQRRYGRTPTQVRKLSGA